MEALEGKTRKIILTSQRNEITEHLIYRKLADSVKDEHNKSVLKRISDDELRHYFFWKQYTKADVSPNRLKVWLYFFLSRILGLTFGVKLMELGEESAQVTYGGIAETLPAVKDIIRDEDEHEMQLIGLIDEEKLKYVGSVVLGLNDALVELTGALAGLSFAFQETRVVAVAGLVTGAAASLSMAASEYHSTKAESADKDPIKASLYTGVAYVLTVLFLIFPFFIFEVFYYALACTIFNAIVVIFAFTFYVSVAKDLPFKKRFTEMAAISLGVAAISFLIGYLIRTFLGIEL